MKKQEIAPGITRVEFDTFSQWLHSRKGIGGSDASAVLGMNPYKTNEELWMEKTWQWEPEDISEKPYVKYGHEAEPLLRSLFALDYPEYQVFYYENNMIKNKRYPWAHASLDGELVDWEGRRGILEIKTTNILQSVQREKWRDKIPDNYYIQILHYLMVTGYDFAILKAQLKSEWGQDIRTQTRHYFIEREEAADDIEILKEAERKFWEDVETRRRPGLILPEI